MSIENYCLLLAGLAIILLSLLWWRKYKYFFNTISTVPMPWFLPIFGNLVHIRKPVDTFWIFHNLLLSLGKGSALRVSLGFYFGLLVADPVLIENLINHSAAQNKSILYKFLSNWLGDGLLLSKGNKWHSRKKLLTPAYHFQILHQYVGAFDKHSNILVQKLRSMEGSNRIDIDPYIALCALDIICETIMATSVNAQTQLNSNFVQRIKEIKHLFMRKLLSLLAHSEFTYQFTFDYYKEKRILKDLHDHTRSVIAARRTKLINEQAMGQNEIENVSGFGAKKKIPLLDIMLNTSLSDEDIREEVDTFIFGGFDTVAVAISFTIYNISKHPSIQQRVHEEQKEIFGCNPNRKVEYNDLQRMKYLEMVIKESLRLFPPIPVIARDITEEIQLGDMVIRKGLQLIIAPFSVHRNASIYPDPEVFDPERFTSDACAKRHPYAYLPFSAGFRNCIGQKFAMLELKATVSKLMQNFEFTDAPDSELKLRSENVLSSTTGIHVGIKKRVW